MYSGEIVEEKSHFHNNYIIQIWMLVKPVIKISSGFKQYNCSLGYGKPFKTKKKNVL